MFLEVYICYSQNLCPFVSRDILQPIVLFTKNVSIPTIVSFGANFLFVKLDSRKNVKHQKSFT